MDSSYYNHYSTILLGGGPRQAPCSRSWPTALAAAAAAVSSPESSSSSSPSSATTSTTTATTAYFFADTVPSRGTSSSSSSSSSSIATTTTVSQQPPAPTTTTTTTARVQILMSDTGGGHRASANALRDALHILVQQQQQEAPFKSRRSSSSSSSNSTTPGATGSRTAAATTGKIASIDVDIVDIYTDYASIWPFNDYVQVYKTLAANPWMWSMVYYFGASPVGQWLNERLLEWTCTSGFRQCLARTSSSSKDNVAATNTDPACWPPQRRADLVISVHPLTQALPLKLLAELDYSDNNKAGHKTPFCTVVTDLGSAHPTWFHPNVDVCFVPSKALHRAAEQQGLSPVQIRQYGLPIRQGFWASSNNDDGTTTDSSSAPFKSELRQQLGLQNDSPVVLVVGGGDGMGGLVEIAKQLGQALQQQPSGSVDMAAATTTTRATTSQMVVICGKNQRAKLELEAWNAAMGWSDEQVLVQGFVNNMDEWMKASDVLVTKAGPGTIAEASICGLPCMMFAYL
jgi:1,2-diacylglycerol 3-beta-galactosyltransferase